MTQGTRDILVIGGGISGLSTAWFLHRAGCDVRLLESDSQVGGCTRTERRDGFLLEKGPFNVMVRDPAFEELLADASDRVSVVTASKAARARFIYRRGHLRRVPTNPVGLATTPLLSFGGKCRLLGGLLASPRPQGREETIEDAACRRIGKQACDTLVSAVVAGIFAGDIRKLSLRACFPSVWRFDAQARSPIGHGLLMALRWKRHKKHGSRRRWRGLVSIDGGLGALTEVLGRRLGRNLLTRCRAEELQSTGGGYEIVYRNRDGTSEVLGCRRLVMAAPAAEAGRLLQTVVPEMGPIVETIRSASLIVLNLAFRRQDVSHPMQGYGFLVPHDEEDFPLLGMLWADSIFPHQAPEDQRLMRVFFGGARDPQAAARSDDELQKAALDSLGDLLGLSGKPTLVDVCRYRDAIPQYEPGHVEKIERLRAAVAARPDLYLVGNYLQGISLNDCVRLAKETADRMIAEGPGSDREAGPPWEPTAAGCADPAAG